jgi:hypothetical protein
MGLDHTSDVSDALAACGPDRLQAKLRRYPMLIWRHFRHRYDQDTVAIGGIR